MSIDPDTPNRSKRGFVGHHFNFTPSADKAWRRIRAVYEETSNITLSRVILNVDRAMRLRLPPDQLQKYMLCELAPEERRAAWDAHGSARKELGPDAPVPDVTKRAGVIKLKPSCRRIRP